MSFQIIDNLVLESSKKHLRARNMVCRNCCVKVAKNGVSLTPRFVELFETHYNESIDLSNIMLPNVLYTT